MDKLYDLILNVPLALQWILFILCVVVGFFALVKGADIFVDSASKFAKMLKIPAIVIGLTVVAFGTSAPEASVSITAIINKSAGISVGNIIGSNLFNLLVVLGVSAIAAPIVLDRLVVKRDISTMLISSLMLVVFAFLFDNGESRALVWFEGLAFLVVFVVYLVYMIRFEMKRSATINPEQHTEENDGKKGIFKTILFLILSLAAVVVGGNLVNVGAKGVAVKMGVSETLAGLTICAIGTSLPELVTSIVAIKRHENDIAIGNVIGSNLFNVMFILGTCSIISPLAIDGFALFDICVMLGIFVIFTIYSFIKDNVNKPMGWAMLITYILFFAFIIIREYVPII